MAHTPVEIPDDAMFLDFRQQCESEQGWITKYSKRGITVAMQFPPPDGKPVAIHKVKCHFTIKDVPSETLYDVLHDVEYRKKWDFNMIETRDIARIGPNTDVGYYSWKCPKPLKNRDVVTLRSWLVVDKYHMIVNISVKHPDFPPRKDLVRAVSLLAGYLITSTGPNSCILTYLAQVDPKGSLPKWVVNKSSQFLAPRVLKKIYKACLNYPAWKKINQPQFKPWLNPEQNTLPTIPISKLAMQHAESLENIDESALIDANEDKGGNSDDENDGKN
ncbi:START domain-containing protein 10-like isoform X2 [Ambystoma mexicanum]|uniref:START domain-containing protein 10-like isoform X2 n=1 Tax=Ambystoma mexicanum TaxID=8296 RepID=UPI0037E6FDCB